MKHLQINILKERRGKNLRRGNCRGNDLHRGNCIEYIFFLYS